MCNNHHGDLKTLKSLIKNQEVKIDAHKSGIALDFQDISQDIHIHKRKHGEKIEFRIPLQNNCGVISDEDRSNPLYEEVKNVLDSENFEKFAQELKGILKNDCLATGKQARRVVNRLRKYFGLSNNKFKQTTRKYTDGKLSLFAARLADRDEPQSYYYFIVTPNYIIIGDDYENFYERHFESENFE